MVIRRMALVCIGVALSLGLTSAVWAQGKKKPSSYPGWATFRCYGAVGQCVGADDGVLGQITSQNPGGDYPGSGIPESGRGAHLRTASNEFWIGLRDGFTVRLDLSRRVADPTVPCQQGGYCQYASSFGSATSLLLGESSYAEMQTSVVDGDDTSVSLLDVSTDPGNPSSVRLLMSFYDSSGKLWNFNFGDHRNSGAENASVYRSAPCTWVFTDGGSLAELSTLVKLQGKQFRSYEGLYSAPFEFTFTASQCPAP